MVKSSLGYTFYNEKYKEFDDGICENLTLQEAVELLFDEAGVYFHECEVIDCDSFKMVMEKANQIEMKGNNYPSIIEQLGINNKKETNRKEMLRDMKKSLVNMR